MQLGAMCSLLFIGKVARHQKAVVVVCVLLFTEGNLLELKMECQFGRFPVEKYVPIRMCFKDGCRNLRCYLTVKGIIDGLCLNGMWDWHNYTLLVSFYTDADSYSYRIFSAAVGTYNSHLLRDSIFQSVPEDVCKLTELYLYRRVLLYYDGAGYDRRGNHQ